MNHSKYYRWLKGQHKSKDLGTTYLDLSSDDADVGTLGPGTPVGEKSDNIRQAVHAGPQAFFGVLQDSLDAEGFASDAAFKKLALGDHPTNIAKKKGCILALRCPAPDSEAEVEGKGEVGIGNFVATEGEGALQSDTARNTQLTFENGSLRIAADGEMVFAHFIRKITAVAHPTNYRAHIRYCSPYKCVIPA